MMIIDILSEDSTSNFSSCQRMVEAVLSIRKTKGACERGDLLSHAFSPEEIDRFWDAANFFTQFDLQEDFKWEELLSA
jgi:hypothetical protein